MVRGLVFLLVLASVALGSTAAAARPGSGPELVEVVVGLAQRPLSTTEWAAGREVQERTLVGAQRRVAGRIRTAVPQARLRWRYRLVANGLAVVLPRSSLPRLAAVRGVERIYPSVRYAPRLDRSPQQIGAPALWQPGLTNAGQGLKIGIIDEGIDQTHPFFDPAGYTMPSGFPKGQRAFTTAKVIVARAFPPARPVWRHAAKPFDPELSSHGTHVAGIAAGNANTAAAGVRISGVAPRAYLGNYKALTVPTDADLGLNGNAPEIVAAIEAAVADGMDVINLSLGEPEVEPARDLIAEALNAAAKAGVVPVVAAGNDYDDFGRGSIASPGSTASAITVGAVTTSQAGPAGVIAPFSSSAPTPLSLALKPEVAAPGANILSAAPRGEYTRLSGTSMAAPHVAGAVALLLQRHPDWTPAQVKSALALTGDRAFAGGGLTVEASPARGGGGVVNLPRADVPLVFADPVALSFGLVAPSTTATRTVALTDAGGGAGDWAVSVEQQTAAVGATLTVPPSVAVPGTLTVTLTTAGSPEAELSGFVVLTRGAERRRLPYWLRVSAPQLGRATPVRVLRPGLHRATTRGGTRLVSHYRYPELTDTLGIPSDLSGPERVFRVRLTRAVANFGVVVTSTAPGVSVQPRTVRAGDENRLTGVAALPTIGNPYLRNFHTDVPASGALLPARGNYDVVFDTPAGATPGAFTFRFWVDDVSPPALSLPSRTVRRGARLVVRATDAGAGVDADSLVVRFNGEERRARLAGDRILVPTRGLARGRHSLFVQVSDYQETRNQENVSRILPNTRVLRARITVR